jgi:predicted nuclease with TOPRIM domain
MASEVASLRDDNASLRGELEKAQDALANLRVRYHQLLEELHLLKRRLVVAKAERLDDIADAQLAFDKLLAETQAIKKVLDDAAPSDEPKDESKDASSPPPSDKPRGTRNTAPTGRRDLSTCDLPEIRIELH